VKVTCSTAPCAALVTVPTVALVITLSGIRSQANCRRHVERHHRLGEIRDRTYKNQQHRASGLNLLVTAIILWNTHYLNRAITALREVEDVPDHLLAHLSALGWGHVNLTGDYIWAPADQLAENRDGFRPLRPAPALLGGVKFPVCPLMLQKWAIR
jgi:hypothetical protein